MLTLRSGGEPVEPGVSDQAEGNLFRPYRASKPQAAPDIRAKG